MALTQKEHSKLKNLIVKCDDLELSVLNATVGTLIDLRNKNKLEELF